MTEEEFSQKITDSALEVHRLLGGPGLLESIYECALCHELSLRGLRSQRQFPIPVIYKNTNVREPLYLDILVEGKAIIEVKATGKDYPLYHAQLFTHLRLMGVKLGFLINFGKDSIKDGIIVMHNNR